MSRNSREYRALLKATGKLTRAVKNNITSLCADLVASDLITPDQQRALRNPNINVLERAADLVQLIADKVEESPVNYHTFIKSLEEDRATYKDVLESLVLPDDPAPSTGTAVQGASKCSGGSSRLQRNGKPKVHELDRIDYNGKTIRVIPSSAAKWEKIATRLYFDGNTIGAIRRDTHYQVEQACTTVLNIWLEGKDGLREPKTGATVINVLVEADLGTLSNELNSVLSD